MRISSADWFKAGVARQRADPISLGISPRPGQCDLGKRHSGMLLSPTLSAREVRVACRRYATVSWAYDCQFANYASN